MNDATEKNVPKATSEKRNSIQVRKLKKEIITTMSRNFGMAKSRVSTSTKSFLAVEKIMDIIF